MCFGQGCYSVPLHARPHHGRGIRDPRHRAGMRRFGAQWQPAPMCDERCGRSCTCNRQSALALKKTNRPMMTAGPRPRRRATRHAALRESAYAAPAAPKTTDTDETGREDRGPPHDTTLRSRRRSTSLPEPRVTTTSHQGYTRPDPSTVTTLHSYVTATGMALRVAYTWTSGHATPPETPPARWRELAHAHTRTRARGESQLRSSTSVALHQRDAAPWTLHMSDDPPACIFRVVCRNGLWVLVPPGPGEFRSPPRVRPSCTAPSWP